MATRWMGVVTLIFSGKGWFVQIMFTLSVVIGQALNSARSLTSTWGRKDSNPLSQRRAVYSRVQITNSAAPPFLAAPGLEPGRPGL